MSQMPKGYKNWHSWMLAHFFEHTSALTLLFLVMACSITLRDIKGEGLLNTEIG